MKTSTFRKATALVLSIMLVLSMCMTGISVSAAESTRTIYFAVSTNWQEANARFAAYTWSDGSDGTFTSMTKVTDSIYSAEIANSKANIIFTRMNPATTDNNWDNKWNQTADLTIPADKNCFNINAGEWDGANGTWSTYDVNPTESTTTTTQPITTPVTDSTIFFAPSTSWTQDNARFSMYMWNNSGDNFVSMTKNADGVYTAELPDGYTNVIFVRMNPNTSANDWNDAWNQTADLTVPQGKNYFTLNEGEWDGANGTWSTYTLPTEPTEPVTTQPVTTQPVTTQPVTTVPPTTESTEPTVNESDFTYTVLEDGTAEITGYTGNDSVITVPAKIDGIKVYRIGPEAFKGNTNLTSVTLEEGISAVSYEVFADCTNLKEVICSNGITAIGEALFYNCSSIKTIVLPETLKEIPDFAFDHCTGIEELVIPNGVTYIGMQAFYSCTNLKKLTIPATVTSISGRYGTIPISNTVTIYGYTGTSAEFYAKDNNNPFVALDSSDFTYTVLEDGTAEITGYTGSDSTVVIPSTIDGYKVTSIGSYTISSYYNEDRTALIISEGIKTIKASAFYGWHYLDSVELPESLETIEKDAFRDCQNLTSIKFPANIKTIGDGAFSYCYLLKDVTITGGKLTLVDDWAFHRCNALETVTLNGNNAEIGSYAFKSCESLNSLTLNGIKILGEQAFDSCNLENVVLPDGLERMDYSTFASNTNLKTAVVPESVTYMQQSTFYDFADNFTMFGYSGSYAETFVENNPMLGITFIALDSFEYEVLEDGTIKVTDYFGEGDTLVIPSTIDGYQVSEFDGYSFSRSVKKLVLSNGIKKIADSSCCYWSKLEEVYLADSVEYIGSYAFDQCETLTSVKFPANLEYIGESAFRDCINLKTAEITGGKLTYIASNAFYDCSLLNTVTLNGNNAVIESYAFFNCTRIVKLNLNGIKSIGGNAFYNAFITELVLPEGLETIGSNAFSGCTYLRSLVIPKSITHEISYSTFAYKITVYGYTGTYAEQYANLRGFTFVPLDGGANITGDIDLKLLKTDENIYSADIELEAGSYKFNVDNDGTILGFNKSYTDTASINYSGGFKAQSTLVATGGRYTFTFNTSTKILTIKHKSFDDIVEIKGAINVELVRPNKNTTVFTGTVKLNAGTYYFNVYEGGKIYGLDYLFEDVIYDHAFNWTTPTGFKATGGTYSVRYDSATNKLKIMHTPAGLGDVTIFGDINIPLANQGNGIYSAQKVLDAGSYEIRVDSFGTVFANGSKFTNAINTTFNSAWKAAATLTVTEKMKFTFTFNTNTNEVVVYNSPIDTSKVLVAFDNIDALELTSADGITYTATTTLEAGDYTFRMDEFGIPMGGNYSFTNNKSGLYYDATFSSATKMTATGGTYTFSYNTSTNFLTVTKG